MISAANNPDSIAGLQQINLPVFMLMALLFSIGVVFLIQSNPIKRILKSEKTINDKIILGFNALVIFWVLVEALLIIPQLNLFSTEYEIMQAIITIILPLSLNTIYVFLKNLTLKKPLKFTNTIYNRLEDIENKISEIDPMVFDLYDRAESINNLLNEIEKSAKSLKTNKRKSKNKSPASGSNNDNPANQETDIFPDYDSLDEFKNDIDMGHVK